MKTKLMNRIGGRHPHGWMLLVGCIKDRAVGKPPKIWILESRDGDIIKSERCPVK